MESIFHRFAHGEATEQELFDECAERVIAQGRPAMSGGTCSYTAPNGCHCAIGLVLSSEELTLATNCYNAGTSASELLEALYGTPYNKRSIFANDLQRAHDQASDKDDFILAFKTNLREVAERYGLSAECVAS
jgi:hypothetical protein